MNIEVSHQRTRNYFKQLTSSFVFKLLAIISSFLLIPIMIKYLGNEQYGIWSTLLSIISWVVLFDIGIGNGLRNKIAESMARNDFLSAQKYISTSYVLIGFIALFLLLIFMLISNFINWQTVFNTKNLSNEELKYIVNISVSFLLINFWISLINQVVNGLQKSSISVFNQFLSNFISLVFVYILSLLTESSLVYLSIVYGISLLSSNIIVSIWFYKKNMNLIPKIIFYNKKFVKSITSLGFKFFIIQIAVIVIFTTDKILITQLFGPKYVTNYDIVFKLFSIITIAHSLLMAPLWSAYSDAYHRKDFDWIKHTIKNQLKLYILFIIATITLIISAQFIITLWIGESIKIDKMLLISMGLFVLVATWSNIFAYFVNGVDKLNVQIYTSIIAICINIPISIFIVKYFETGIYGIVLGTTISLSFFAIFGALQTYYILKEQSI